MHPQKNPLLPIMGHLVLGYPTLAESIRTAERYVRAGLAILELQIPFSHPTADGPVITEACRRAVEQKVTVPDCLEAIRTLREKFPEQEMMVMSYVNRVYAYGFDRFYREMERLGVRHVIIPDLPCQPHPQPLPPGGGESDLVTPHALAIEMKNYSAGKPPSPRGEGLGLGSQVAILAANTPSSRLNQLLAAGYDFFYLMSDFKITGSTFSLHPGLQDMAARIKAHDQQNRVGIGFGIETPEQVLAVLEVADYAIIGSALIRAQQEARLDNYLEKLKKVLTPATFPV
ncbi:MAG: tryptophan synthase subunit alpha [Lewinellaceae bacterium]|nr:tryptophan synthase subunit alpha [Saprospiraceae bacterium]MCB9331912.1 tryptophan synthase subunit alpha [Lewinellaceae bacterium]